MSDTKERELQAIGKAAASSICEMVAALGVDYERIAELCSQDILDAEGAAELKELQEAAGDCTSEEEARERIMEDPLSIEVRSGWHALGEQGEPEEFCILLATGGPAVRIRGELGAHGEPHRAWLQVQDWFTPWTDYVPEAGEGFGATLLAYCQCFYFGEGGR